jgi:predicted ferric reductase
MQGQLFSHHDDDLNEHENTENEGPYSGDSSLNSLTTDQATQQQSSSAGSLMPWYTSRAAGIASYLLMFIIIFMGEGMTSGFAYQFASPVRIWLTHKYLGISLGITIIIHMLSLLMDKFIGFNIGDILIPFYSSYQPFLLNLGIFAFYILIIVLISSIFIRLEKPYLWRKIHYFVYPMFLLALIHGLFLGSDSKLPAIQIMYGATGLIFALLMTHRFKFHLSRK